MTAATIASPAAGRFVPRRSRPRFLILLGIALSAIILGGSGLILLSFGGTFNNFVLITAQVPQSSTAVPLNSPVEYRDVTVGKVVSEGTSIPGGLVSIVVHLDPSHLSAIPANVRATVAPVSIFGNQYVILQPPADPSPTPLRAGATVPALETNKTASLQSTLADLDHLLIALHPGQLDAALTSFANALVGQGTSLGQNLIKADNYFKQMLPLWPTLVADLNTFAPVGEQIAASAPNIVGIFANSVDPSNAVSSAGATQIQNLFANGATLANYATQLFTSIQKPFELLAAASGPFLNDISANPQEIAQVIYGLSSWAASWCGAESTGPYLNLTATINVNNPADLALALLGGSSEATDLADGLGAGLVNPPTYTSPAPPYSAAPYTTPTLPGAVTGCGTANTTGVRVGVQAASSEQQAIGHIVKGLTGSTSPSLATATLLVAPVLESVVGGK